MAGISREERERRSALKASTIDFTPPTETAMAQLPAPTSTSDVVVPPKSAEPAKVPQFSVAERRLKHGDLSMLSADADITIVGQDEPMALYWGLTEDAHENITKYGWVPVMASELPMTCERMGLQKTPDGIVARGKNCSEILMKMPKRLRDQILLRQSQDRYAKRTSTKDWRNRMASAAASDAADESLSPEQRERAKRHADSMASTRGDKAQYHVTEFKETHSGQPIE